MNNNKLLFVYNAKSGFINSLKDLIHKNVRPSTYACALCALTYNGSRMNKRWKEYVASLNLPTKFLYKDTFSKKYPNSKITYPAILLQTDTHLKVIVSKADFNKLKDLDSLINLLNNGLAKPSE